MGQRRKIKLPGTVQRRPSGRYTAVTGQVSENGIITVRRESLGTFDTEEEAERCLQRHHLLEEVRPGSESGDERTLLIEYLSGWIAHTVRAQEAVGDIALSTRRDYEQVVENHLKPDLGHLRLEDLDTAQVRVWLRRLRSKGLSDRTVQKLWRVLHRAMEDADLARNPARLQKRDRPRVKSRKQVVRPTVADVNAFLEHVASCEPSGACPPAVFWRLVATTGLRRSEACGLTWPDLEIMNGDPVVSIRRGLHPVGRRLHVGPPKSNEGRRTVSISENLALDLRTMRASRPEVSPVVIVGSNEPLDFVFRSSQDLRPLNPDAATRWFPKEWSHAELQPGVTLHGLRHSHGSALLAAGRPPIEVAARMGHSPQVLLTIYARDLDEAGRLDRMRAVTEDLYG